MTGADSTVPEKPAIINAVATASLSDCFQANRIFIFFSSVSDDLFFKWIKPHLCIKRFFGPSANAVKSQIGTAVSVDVLIAIVKKRLNLDASLYTLLQILSVTLFKKMPLQQAFPGRDSRFLTGQQ